MYEAFDCKIKQVLIDTADEIKDVPSLLMTFVDYNLGSGTSEYIFELNLIWVALPTLGLEGVKSALIDDLSTLLPFLNDDLRGLTPSTLEQYIDLLKQLEFETYVDNTPHAMMRHTPTPNDTSSFIISGDISTKIYELLKGLDYPEGLLKAMVQRKGLYTPYVFSERSRLGLIKELNFIIEHSQ